MDMSVRIGGYSLFELTNGLSLRLISVTANKELDRFPTILAQPHKVCSKSLPD